MRVNGTHVFLHTSIHKSPEGSRGNEGARVNLHEEKSIIISEALAVLAEVLS